MPTPIGIPELITSKSLKVDIAVYLNPHFRDIELACSLEKTFIAANCTAYCVGEGYANRKGWIGQDTDWISRACQSKMILTAPGMGGLSAGLLFDKPLLLLATQQPEQLKNARKFATLGLIHRVLIWNNNSVAFEEKLLEAIKTFNSMPQMNDEVGREKALERLNLWIKVLELISGGSSGKS